MAEYLRGIDVSHHNTPIKIQTIAEDKEIGLDFIIAKATEGWNFRDSAFDVYMSMANREGLLRGAYHYVNAPNLTANSAETEAYNFVSMVRPYGDTLLALDFEESKMLNQQGVDYLFAVASTVKKVTGTPPLIYLSEAVLKRFDFSKIKSLGCGVWVAKWGNNAAKSLYDVGWPYTKAYDGGFGTLAIQQISSKAELAGKEMPLDVDVAFMTRKAWAKYANPRL